MIRFTDGFVLAYTKLRTHRVRTGLTVGLAGILFGLILAAIFLVQGVFDSVERFSDEGLNNRTILQLSRSGPSPFETYEHTTDEKFIGEVEAKHKAIVDKKTAAAKRYGVDYDPKTEDPSPIEVDKASRERRISDDGMNSQAVEQAAADRRAASQKADTFTIQAYLKQYSSAHILPGNFMPTPENGTLSYMKDGKEAWATNDKANRTMMYGNADSPSLYVLNGSVVKPFINKPFDPTKGEIPVVIPYSQAEKLLGLKALEKSASTKEKLDRLHEVRQRIGEVTASYCYRNQASEQLLNEAASQTEQQKKYQGTPDYQAPSLQYTLPSTTSCGAVKVAKDARTALEKQQDDARMQYEKAIGEHAGNPEQQLIKLRAVGIAGDLDVSGSLTSVGELVSGLLGSNLGYNTWAIPNDLLRQVPEKDRPAAVFNLDGDTMGSTTTAPAGWSFDSWLVEFDDKDEARKLVQSSIYQTEASPSGSVSGLPFGSGTLFVDEAKTWFATFMFWALITVGGVAAIILSGLIGRTVSEGRRESAVFRAIGAKRTDIAGIYGMYALLLSLRVALFAGILGAAITLVVELLYWRDATLAARLAYAASDTGLEFHLFSVASWYVPLILAVIVVTSLLGSIIPIIRNARRNPINDMRDE